MSCEVWWAWTGDVRAEHEALLDAPESRRLATFRRDDDRFRYLTGCVLTRLVLGMRKECDPAAVAIDRTCATCGEPHGPPRVAGGPALSVAHSGELVAVAFLAGGGARVGIDVERIDGSAGVVELAGEPVLSADEALALHALPQAARPGALLRLWTRKEAVLKATGDGLGVEPSAVAVSGPSAPARLLGFRGRPGLEERARLIDLFPAPGYAGALCLLDADGAPDVPGARDAPAPVAEHDAGALLRSAV